MIDSQSRFANASILVVDDAAFSRSLISTALTNAGFKKILLAGDGIEALEKTYSFIPDIVVLDLSMPRLDGFGYCEKIRADKKFPRIPIIVQTAMEDRESKLRALAAGADDFLNKPVDMIELQLRLCGHLDRHFMLHDMTDMCGYLTMELENTRGLCREIVEKSAPQYTADFLEKHCEVLEQLVGMHG